MACNTGSAIALGAAFNGLNVAITGAGTLTVAVIQGAAPNRVQFNVQPNDPPGVVTVANAMQATDLDLRNAVLNVTAVTVVTTTTLMRSSIVLTGTAPSMLGQIHLIEAGTAALTCGNAGPVFFGVQGNSPNVNTPWVFTAASR